MRNFMAAAAALGLLASVGCDTDTDRTPRVGERDLERESGRAADRTVRMTPQEPEVTEEGAKADGAQAQDFQAQDFLKKAAEMNHAEIAAGQLAAEKAENQEVKQYGQRLVEDHKNALSNLQSVAQKQNVTLPEQADEQHRQKMEQLRRKSGAELDKSFVQMMVQDHEKAVSHFERAAQQAEDPQVKAYAEELLPHLKEHLQQAKDLSSKVGAPTAD